MKQLSGLFLVLGLLSVSCYAQHCYSFKNNTTGAVHLQFNYTTPVPVGFETITSVDIQPGATWPEKQWCWSTGPGFSATVALNGPSVIQNGPVTMGNGSGTSDSGTYLIVSQSGGGGSGGDGCIKNTFPGNQYFCVLSNTAGPKMACPSGSPSNTGTWDTLHLRIRCNPNTLHKERTNFPMTCRTDGTHCNQGGDLEFCVGLSSFNVGNHCTQ